MRLTPALIADVCQRIKAGAFEQVAVESLGIAYARFQKWLQRGRRPRAGRLCRQLAQAVLQARAHARLMAEMQLRAEDTKAWLLSGPGRDSAAQEGWGSAAAAQRPGSTNDQGAIQEWFLEFCAALLAALEPFPEARAAVVEVAARLPPPGA
jgi:hypothetical protein